MFCSSAEWQKNIAVSFIQVQYNRLSTLCSSQSRSNNCYYVSSRLELEDGSVLVVFLYLVVVGGYQIVCQLRQLSVYQNVKLVQCSTISFRFIIIKNSPFALVDICYYGKCLKVFD